jgi:glycosyltransferase involved in cell wall biosynthesis
MVSIIIRTHNEERWISLCLQAIFNQNYKDFEVIIVDNKSTDRTLAKAKTFKIKKFLEIDEYLPGKALNLGIKAAKGDLISCLSGHCLPVNNQWLSNLVKNFNEKNVAGVYGRQEPVASSSDFDKRDLLNLFGLDRKVQIKDSFFHNANSMIKHAVWEKIPFDEKVTNIEDRVWAKAVLQCGYKIVYEPEASVYHYHGIHQENNAKRCYNIVKILESLESKNIRQLNKKNLNIIAIIPIKGKVENINDIPLLKFTIARCKQSRLIKRIFVSTDNPDLAKIAIKLGAEAPFLRSKELSAEHIDLETVLQYTLEEIEKRNIFADILVILEATFPFRQKDLLDTMIEQLIDKGLDSVIPARPEYKSCWINKNNEIKRIDEGFMPRIIKEPLHIGLIGLGCVTYPIFIREGRRLGDRVGLVEVNDPYAQIEVRNASELDLAGKILGNWWEKNK